MALTKQTSHEKSAIKRKQEHPKHDEHNDMKYTREKLRLLKIITTLIRYDVIFPDTIRKQIPWSIRQIGRLSRLISNPIKQKKNSSIYANSKENGLRFAHALEKLGPAFIKLGQFMASRSDLFGQAFTDGLSRLKDQAEPFPVEQAKQILKADLGEQKLSHFKTLSPPLFAASIAQIHQLKDPKTNQLKAVKILRPDIKQQLSRDMEAFLYAAYRIEAKIPSSQRLKPVEFIKTLSRTLRLETDLRLEAASQSEMKTPASYIKGIKIPDIDWQYTQENILVTEWIDGVSLNNRKALDQHKIDRKTLARLITRFFLISALDFGVFHADIHEGNLIALKEGGIALVDFGIIGRLTDAERRYLARILYGFLMSDYEFAAKAHFDAGYVPPHHSKAEFASALRAVAEPVFSLKSHEVSMGKVLLHLFEITHIFDMQLRPELILLQKTMVQVEATARNLNPYHNIWETSRPIIENWMKNALSPKHQISHLIEDSYALKETIQELPKTLTMIKDLTEEKLKYETQKKQNPKKNHILLFSCFLMCIYFFTLLLAFGIGYFWN